MYDKKYSFTALSKNECLKNSRGCFFIRSFVETWTQCIDVYYYSPVGLGSAIKKKEGRFKRQSGADLGCDGVPAAIFLHEL